MERKYKGLLVPLLLSVALIPSAEKQKKEDSLICLKGTQIAQKQKMEAVLHNAPSILLWGEISDFIIEMGRKYEVSPRLIKAVIFQESKLNPCAESSAGAQGLMQLMPAIQKKFKVKDPYNWKQNIEAGVQLLKETLERYDGNQELALADYNAGFKAVNYCIRFPEEEN